VSPKKDPEENIRQLESRLQKLESQKRQEEYEQEKNKRVNGYLLIFGSIGMAIFIGIGCVIFSNAFEHPGGANIAALMILGILLLAMLIAGFRTLDN
jgi:hypothetical protein